MRRCALFIRCMLAHSLSMCISHANSFFFNQPTKYRHQSGARRSTTVRTIVVIIVLHHSSYPLEHPLFSLVLFVCRWPNNTRYVCMYSLFSIYKHQLTPLGHLFLLLLFLPCRTFTRQNSAHECSNL
jgi:hypothetical protein